MAATVNTTASGRTYITNSISTIDTAALVEVAVAAKLRPRARIEDQISKNTKTITGYQVLQTDGLALRDAINRLRNATLANPTNPFSARSASFSTSDGTDAKNLLSVTTTSSAAIGEHEIIVSAVAKRFSASGTIGSASASTALGYTGTFDIGAVGGTATTINISATDTLQTIRTAINNTTTTSGVKADIMQVAPGDFRLVITGANTAKNVTVSNITGDNVLQNLGLTNAGGAFTNIDQPAQQASIELNGTTITSDTNKFENVLVGVTIDVKNAAPGTTITTNITTDNTAVASAIKDVVTTYNSLRKTIAANQEITTGGAPADTALLYGDQINLSLGQTISQLATGSYTSGLYNGLGSLGITINSKGDFVVDETLLNTAISTNFSSVQGIFAKSDNTGLADLMYAAINPVVNSIFGSITTAIDSLRSTNTQLIQRSDDISDSVELYREQLIERYSKLEAAMQRAEIQRKSIEAILEGLNNN